MAILPVKYPCTIPIIARDAPLLLIVVAGNGGCYNICGILNNRLISNPSWDLTCGILGWIPTRSSSLWPEVFLDMFLLATLATIHIWPDRWPYYIATTISTVDAVEVKFLQSLVGWLLNGHSVCLWKWRLVLILLFACSRFPLLWINNIVVFMHDSCTRES